MTGYVRWPPRRPALAAVGGSVVLALAVTTVARAGELGAMTLVAAGLFLVLGVVGLVTDQPRSAVAMGALGLSQVTWNLPLGPTLSFLSAGSWLLMGVGLLALVGSHRSNEVQRFARRVEDA